MRSQKKFDTFILLCSISLVGCVGAPKRIQESLRIQNEYTKKYIEFAQPLIQKCGDESNKEEMSGIGAKLMRNSENLYKWSLGGKEQKEDK